MKEKRKDRFAGTSSGAAAPPSPCAGKAEGKAAVRYQHWYCEPCKKKLEGLGYILTETGRAAAWRNCGLCGSFALITPTDLYKPPARYRYRTGAGERARAGRR
jgi:hypothetical protein